VYIHYPPSREQLFEWWYQCGISCLAAKKRERINPASLVPKSVSIESSINDSSEEIHSSTSSVQQVPEFGKHKYKDCVVIVKLQLVFDGAFPYMKIKTITK
jgi:hypothetical protein